MNYTTMFAKIFVPFVLLGCALAQHHATSYSSINHNIGDNHHHGQQQQISYGHQPQQQQISYGHQPQQQQHHASSYASVTNHVSHVQESHHQVPQIHVQPQIHLVHKPVAVPVHHQEEHYPHHHPKYQFKYGVEDKHTHDIKSQEEQRDGDVVKGYYTLLQPDGRTRTVHYTSDKHSGFNAQVAYSGHAAHPEQHHH